MQPPSSARIFSGDALDGIGTALSFVDASGQIIHANASGHDMLAQGTLVHTRGGKLILNDASAEQGLYEIFELGYRTVAAVFGQKASLDMPSPQDVIAKFYKLTPTELYVRRLFAKTGTDRQAGLVKLVVGHAHSPGYVIRRSDVWQCVDDTSVIVHHTFFWNFSKPIAIDVMRGHSRPSEVLMERQVRIHSSHPPKPKV